MPRAPFQVLVYPYRLHTGGIEYALFKRADAGFWQAVAGGGEDSETALEAARRETWEEAGLPLDSDFLRLDSIESIRVTEFKDSYLWGENVYVIPQFCFGVLVSGQPIVLSDEHSEYAWFSYAEADRLVKFDGNKTALWELNQKLTGRGPRG
jgi:dATP pyrophosphohydrolase